MLEIYYQLVINGVRTIDSVPTKYREAVQALIDERSAGAAE